MSYNKKMILSKRFYLFLLPIFISCVRGEKVADKPIVSVGDKMLTESQLCATIPVGTSSEDSAVLAQDFVRRWVNREVMLRKAQLNLTADDVDIDHLIEEYRTALLVNRYQQKLVEKKFAPTINESEIENYYNEMRENFHLNESIFKGVFAIIPIGSPHYDEFKKIFAQRGDDNTVALEQYLFQNARKYQLSLDKWITLSSVKKYFPASAIPNEANILLGHRDYEVTDDNYVYLLSVRDAKLVDDYCPLEYVSEKIRAILLNKERITFVKTIETQLYDEALNEKIIKYYDNK